MDREELIGSREAARRLGVAPLTLRRRVNRGELTTYVDPLDDRRKLIRAADLETLRQPKPALSNEVTAASAA